MLVLLYDYLLCLVYDYESSRPSKHVSILLNRSGFLLNSVFHTFHIQVILESLSCFSNSSTVITENWKAKGVSATDEVHLVDS